MVEPAGALTVYVVAVNPRDLESTFVRAHIDRLPARTVPIHGWVPAIGATPVLSQRALPRLVRKIGRLVRRQSWNEEIVHGYVRAFAARPAVVLAEFGPTAVRLLEPCRRAGLPLIAHFHGYDISVRSVIDEHREGYRQLFRDSAAIIAVSRPMQRLLIDMGAPAERVHYCPYGVDCDLFHPGDVAQSPPTILAVGGFVEKKAPHLTILAFAEMYRRHPAARLRMIGDGPLFGACVDQVSALGLENAVTFLGNQPHSVVAAEMRAARCFVQHSVRAWNGNCEGTPNAVLEAAASGLPVVATRHAGIADVVADGITGVLVDERDISGMARGLLRVIEDPQTAARMGRAGRHRAWQDYAKNGQVGRLWSIIESVHAGSPAPGTTSVGVAPPQRSGSIHPSERPQAYP